MSADAYFCVCLTKFVTHCKYPAYFLRYQTYHLFRLEKAKEESIIITFPELFFSGNRVSILFFFFVSDIWGNWQLSFFFYCITIYVQRQKRNFHHYIAHSKIRGILQRLVKKIGLNLARNLFSKKKPSCNLLQNYISLWLNVKKRVVYEIQ